MVIILRSILVRNGDETMEEKSISDIIEKYLKSILEDDEKVEIRRSEIADHFDVVPSQINYVIKTRFTLQNGYLVQSKRGGGGYIRIERVNLIDDVDVLDMLISTIGDSISENDAVTIIQTLYAEKVITHREGDLMLVALSKDTLSFSDRRVADQVRARILISLLNRLRFES
jgi:transcriptional regulator CtsR